MNVVFLDIDGVLNLDEIDANYRVHNLYSLVFVTNSMIVLSSEWRLSKDSTDQLINKLSELTGNSILCDKIVGTTDNLINEIPLPYTYQDLRAYEISKYIESHNEIDNYVVLDDADLSTSEYIDNSHFVKIDPVSGLNINNIMDAIRIIYNIR